MSSMKGILQIVGGVVIVGLAGYGLKKLYDYFDEEKEVEKSHQPQPKETATAPKTEPTEPKQVVEKKSPNWIIRNRDPLPTECEVGQIWVNRETQEIWEKTENVVWTFIGQLGGSAAYCRNPEKEVDKAQHPKSDSVENQPQGECEKEESVPDKT